MKKVIKTTKTVYLCDYCGGKISNYCKYINCSICNKDVCDTCYADKMYKKYYYSLSSESRNVCKICAKDKMIIDKTKMLDDIDQQEKELRTKFDENMRAIFSQRRKITDSIVLCIDKINGSKTNE